MRIAMVSEHASPLAALGGADAGGQNVYVGQLAAALARLGHDVRVYTRRDGRELPDVVPYPAGAGHRVLVVHVPAGPPEELPKDDLLPYMDEFGRWMRDEFRAGPWRPDLVHAHFWMSGLAARTAAEGLDIPVVQTFHALGTVKRRHQGADDTSPKERLVLERELATSVDRVIALCSDEVFELRKMGAERHRISVVPSGVDLDRFCPDGPAAPRDPAVPRVLGVGRLVRRKGFDVLVEALRWVPRAELVIAGGPAGGDLDGDPEVVRLRGVARRCRVADRVRFVGGVSNEDMPAWYRSADVLATTPWYEPFGITPLEAMATGLPVVASAVGGLVDTVHAGVTGMLVPPRDPLATGQALRRLLTDPFLRDQQGASARERACGRYSWHRIATDIARTYHHVVSTADTPEPTGQLQH
jgi:glycosyltransferase involved in cell wall biosynthesis